MAFLRSRVTEPPGSYKTVPSIIPCILSPRLASLGGAACCCAGGTPRHVCVCVWGHHSPVCLPALIILSPSVPWQCCVCGAVWERGGHGGSG